jgi:hypothetical protein
MKPGVCVRVYTHIYLFNASNPDWKIQKKTVDKETVIITA